MLESSGKFVWYPHARCGFAIGKLVDISQTNITVRPVAWPSAASLNYEFELHQQQQTLAGSLSSNLSISNNNNNHNHNHHFSKATSKQQNGEPKQQQQQEDLLEFPYKSVYPCDQFDDAKLAAALGPSPQRRQAQESTTAARNRLLTADVDDSCALMQLNEAALLENVRLRFHRDKIYTYVAHILIAVNPYFEVPGLHSPEAIARYQGKSLGTMPPHVYAIADKAYRDMKAFKQSQSIIISGESGAGKTESQKYVLRYLCLSGSQSGRLEKLILDANPILEAFGNAKTIRNNNSSRFGKFIEVHYGARHQVTGGLFFHYLLEKSRLCVQSPGERNYHIFYQLCACLPEAQWRALDLGPPDKFRYLAAGCTQYFSSHSSPRGDDNRQLAQERKSRVHLEQGPIQDQLMDEARCYAQTDAALANFGLDEERKLAIYGIVAAVLHLGNIQFVADDPEDNRGGCKLAQEAEPALATTARLTGLDADLLRQALVSRIMSTARGGHKGTVYMVQLSAHQAQAARDALAKAIYAKLFDYLVTRLINRAIPSAAQAGDSAASSLASTTTTTTTNYIGVLDVAGFEYFQHNSFEQLLINFCNEKLQQFFNERILKEEQNIYETEGLNLARVEFVDNQDCLQLFEVRARGIFDLLDEESRLPKPSAAHFTQALHVAQQAHFRLALPRASKLRAHREIRDDEGFLVRHFAGAVCYETHSFIDKNNDALHASLKSLMLEADNHLLRELFSADSHQPTDASQQQHSSNSTHRSHFSQQPPPPPGGAATSSSFAAAAHKLNFVSVAGTFRSQLNDLMHKLRSTGSHFIRCVKPNSEMVAHKFEGAQILSQLHCSGMDSVLRLMQQGYPSRLSFQDLYAAYAPLLPPELARLDAHLFCRALFKALGLADADFRFGSSKVFFKPAKFAEFDQIVRANSDSGHMALLIRQVSRWLVRWRWRKLAYAGLSVVKLHRKILFRREQIVRLQKNWRVALVQRRLKFRLAALRAARQVEANLCEFEQIIASQLKASPERHHLERESGLLRAETSEFASALRSSVQATMAGLSGSGGENSTTQDSASWERKLDLLRTKRDLLIRSIRDKIARERAALAQLEQQVAAERARREADEVARRQDEQLKRQRAELEARRQADASVEAAAAAQLSSRSARLVDSATDPISLLQASASEEQEQRDYEIALRLAQDRPSQAAATGQSGAAAVQAPVAGVVRAPSESGAAHLEAGRYAGLAKWKYSDLRDTINTSCDLELLEACKREFHRRLKVYHAWRALNSGGAALPAAELPGLNANQSQQQQQQRAPSCIMNQSAGDCNELTTTPTASRAANGVDEPEQRYFRIPFLRQGSTASGGQRGWWFAHFDGLWIARQLELHPNREPILLVAGQHDIDMCELSLQETRLVSKRGAEILAREFEAEWQRHGGQPYAPRRRLA